MNAAAIIVPEVQSTSGGAGNPRITMLWPVEKRIRYAAIRERMTRAEGRRMRCIRGAKAAHQAMRAQGRTPGDVGRAAIAANRAARKRDREEGKGWRHGQTNMSGILIQ
jgi:hypothetical protein